MSTATPRPRRARRRFWLILAAVVLVIFLGWRWLRPSTPRLQAIIPLEDVIDDGSGTRDAKPLFFATHDVLLCNGTTPNDPTRTRLTLTGWDGKPCWRVTAPIGCKDFKHINTSRSLALSPDGHVLAMALPDTCGVRVLSWRDGRLLGDVRLPRQAGSYSTLNVTDSSRIWLMKAANPCRLWAIDGTQVAEGEYRTNMRDVIYRYFLSPDGTALFGGGTQLGMYEYATLQVIGKRVIATNRSTGKINELAPTWYPDGEVVGKHGELMSPTGLVHGPDGWQLFSARNTNRPMLQMKGNRLRVFLLPPDHPWELPLHKEQSTESMCSSDGRVVAVSMDEEESSKTITALERFPYLKRTIEKSITYKILFYRYPGRLCAILPIGRADALPSLVEGGIRYDMTDGSLSPDGHRVALLCEDPQKHQVLLVYKW